MVEDNTNTRSDTNGNPNKQHDLENNKNKSPLHRSAFRALVQDFSPLWFTWCMNSGVLGILTHQSPYQFQGLGIISTIFYVFDLVLFAFFSIVFILRFLIFQRDAYKELTSQPAELMLSSCWPIAFMTLTSLTGLIASNASWGGHSFTILTYVMWWICVAWSLVFLFVIFGIIIRRHDLGNGKVPMMIIIPAVSVSTVAVTGGIITSNAYEVNARLAVPVIVVSFMMVGTGILLGLLLSSYLFYQMLAQGWPAPAMSASVFIFVGPMGQSAAALQALGQSASTYGAFGGYNKGAFLTAESARALVPACDLVALMLTGLGIIWLVFSVMVMVERALARQLEWSPGWNSIIFPTGTLVTSFSLFSIEMDSPAFRVVTVAMIIILVIVFLGNLVFTALGIAKGKLLVVREDPRVKKKMADEQKER